MRIDYVASGPNECQSIYICLVIILNFLSNPGDIFHVIAIIFLYFLKNPILLVWDLYIPVNSG